MTPDPQPGGAPSRDAPLGLTSILVDTLPDSLTTASAPDSYTVEAVFTRDPDRLEIDGIVSPDSRALLDRAGYPAVELTVADNRLQIANTTLEELRDGLAAVLADLVAAVFDKTEDDRAAPADERRRRQTVGRLAASVGFTASGDMHRMDGGRLGTRAIAQAIRDGRAAQSQTRLAASAPGQWGAQQATARQAAHDARTTEPEPDEGVRSGRFWRKFRLGAGSRTRWADSSAASWRSEGDPEADRD